MHSFTFGYTSVNGQYFVNFISAMKFCDCFATLQVHKVLIETVTNTRMHSPHGCTHMYVLCVNLNKLNILTSCFTLLKLSQNTTIHFSISI